eukprot:360058-Chlamydomonas_euryale.AAC.3
MRTSVDGCVLAHSLRWFLDGKASWDYVGKGLCRRRRWAEISEDKDADNACGSRHLGKAADEASLVSQRRHMCCVLGLGSALTKSAASRGIGKRAAFRV